MSIGLLIHGIMESTPYILMFMIFVFIMSVFHCGLGNTILKLAIFLTKVELVIRSYSEKRNLFVVSQRENLCETLKKA